ncbi:MAG: PilZ domain-containing protein [Bacillota bacterium]|nr:PilZ domain-containing protein [Bacillota bacterium]
MDLLDVSIVREGDPVNFINFNRTIFLGVMKKVYKGCLAVAVEIHQENYRRIGEKEFVEFILAFKQKAYRCMAQVVGNASSGGLQILLLNSPKIVASLERRQFRRLQTIMDIDYCFLPISSRYESLSKIEHLWFKKLKRSFTVDISAGGVCLITYEDNVIEQQAIVSMNIKEQQVTTLCSVVRIESAGDNKNQKTALKYIDADRKHIQLIDSFVLEKAKEQ